jgi:hypothetical protein
LQSERRPNKISLAWITIFNWIALPNFLLLHTHQPRAEGILLPLLGPIFVAAFAATHMIAP